MRKSLFLLLAAMSCVSAFAQDVIITRDAKRIEAKIEEVSNVEIKYKKSSNLDGPLFVMATSEINSILFENGEVQVYDTAANASQEETVQNNADAATIAPYISAYNDTYTLYSGNTVTAMDEQAYLSFLQNNCPEAWASYQKGTRLWKTGWGLFGAGLGSALLIGAPMYFYGAAYGLGSALAGANTTSHAAAGCVVAGAFFMGAGSLMTSASIPLLIVGSIKRNNTHEVYNETCSRRPALSLNLQTSADGIGLALKF